MRVTDQSVGFLDTDHQFNITFCAEDAEKYFFFFFLFVVYL